MDRLQWSMLFKTMFMVLYLLAIQFHHPGAQRMPSSCPSFVGFIMMSDDNVATLKGLEPTRPAIPGVIVLVHDVSGGNN